MLFLAALAASPAWAGQVRTTLVVDANTTPVVADSDARGFYAFDGLLYFSAWRGDTGRQLFASDGVSPQVRLIHDFTADGQLSDPYVLGRIGNRLIVSTKDITVYSDISSPHVVLALDLGTGETTRLVEFAGQYNGYTWRIERVGETPGQVLFTDLIDGTVWSTDGTAQGTAQRYAPSPLDNAVSARSACVFGDSVVFAGLSGEQRVIWISDGTAQGSHAVTAIAESGIPDSAIRAGNACYFVAVRPIGWALWRSDGTVAGTTLETTGTESPNGPVAALGDTAYVLASGNSRVTLVRSDQRTPVFDRTGYASDLAAAAGRLAFSYSPLLGSGRNVLVSDGTVAGTRAATLDGAPLVVYDGDVVAAGDRFYASAGDTLYAIDPLTAQAVNLGSRPGFRSRWDVASLGALAFDAVGDAIHGNELWSSDGTAAGTRLLHDIAQRNADGIVAPNARAIVRNDTVFFANALYPADGVRMPLWRTDGTASGTRALAHPAGREVVTIAAFSDDIVFSTANPDEPAARLYRTSRDFASTQLIWDPLWGTSASVSADGNALVFRCSTTSYSELNLCGMRSTDLQASVLIPNGDSDGDSNALVGGLGAVVITHFNHRLWRSDGTLPGTFEISPGASFTRVSPNSAGITAGGALLFPACRGPNASDCGLHRTDGTAAGTYRVASLQSSQITALAPLGQRAVFGTFEGALWVTDGSVAGTQRLAADAGIAYDIASTGSRVHLVARRTAPDEIVYFVSDGTLAGTRRVLPPAGFYLGDGTVLAVDTDTVVFSCWGEDSGFELCRVDGNGDGWTLAADIAPGRRSSLPRQLARAGNIAYFTADDGTRGSELWRVEPLVDAIFAAGFQP
jgi:ELWxxDGT repeat protein